ncbi:methyl-accepting chemotaxis protein [Desulfoluna butyratoxydans]|uniref:Methyl-accepting chemotaxis protein (Mcp) signalling domain n=1 Tax=Desulfoluna butyratoxydans TaxID=231438 RepID=A0A4U8YPN1_9BACT|nr:methyl-accepting chemotaxis protein [Desulfoluna butyratoxydans]VFQ46205.1 methyl-accepting chemotaxis protein (mcp) signalling domain [Desulfoluna butyratoxydans]
MFLAVSLRTKLIGGFSLLVAVLLVVGSGGYLSLDRVIRQAGQGYTTLELDAELNNLSSNQAYYAKDGDIEQFQRLNKGMELVHSKLDELEESSLDNEALTKIETGRQLYVQKLTSLRDAKEKKAELSELLRTTASKVKAKSLEEYELIEESIRKEVLHNSNYQLKKTAFASVRNLVDVAHDAVSAMHSSGLSRKKALDVLRKMHFGTGNYFFVLQKDYTLIAHGADRTLEGSDFSTVQDKNTGKTFMVDLVKGAVSDGLSITEYSWPKPNKGNTLFPKATVAQYYEPWDLVICAGVYMDDLVMVGQELGEVIEDGFSRFEDISALNSTLTDARIAAFSYLTFNSDPHRVNEILKGLIDMDTATDSIRALATEYITTWNSYVTLVELEKTIGIDAHNLIEDASNTMHVMAVNSETAFVQSASWGKTGIVLFTLIGAVLAVGAALVLIVSITRPLKQTCTMLRDIAEGDGDLTQRLVVASRDELGEMANWFNTFVENLQQMIRDIAGNSETLSASSSKLTGLAGRMAQGAEASSSKSHTVAAASEQMSSNMEDVARETEQSSGNLNAMASATEEMTSTIGEISHNSESARDITGQAVNQTRRAKKKVGDLGDAAQAIGKVTETIGEISEQINLLALNATIEAARAGDAGKGFAVVADEIKELAKQTAISNQEVKERISGVQASTEETVTEIDAITKIVDQVNQIVITIAAAIEEQSVTTTEISGNINKASSGIQTVSDKILESTQVSRDMARQISHVNTTAEEMTDVSTQVRNNATELQSLADKLTSLVGRFRV